MQLANTLLNAFFDVLIQPFRTLNPWLGLAALSLVMAVIALLAFRVAGNATAITRIKTRIGAYLLEMRIYRDDLKVLLLDPWRILGLNLKYAAHALPPFLLILPPMLLAIVQIESRYAWRPLEPGERTILTVGLSPDANIMSPSVRVETSSGVARETDAVRVPSRSEISWRLRALEPGRQWVRVHFGDGSPVEKHVWVDGAPRSLACSRTARVGGLAALAEPAEPPLPRGGAVREVRVSYPHSGARFWGLSTAVWIFFALSTLFGFALKNVMRVTI